MKLLSTSEIYRSIDSGERISSKIKSIIKDYEKNKVEADENLMKDIFDVASRNSTYMNIAKRFVKECGEGSIKMFYDERMPLTKALSFIPVTLNGNKDVLFINLTHFVKRVAEVDDSSKVYVYKFKTPKIGMNVMESALAVFYTASKYENFIKQFPIKKFGSKMLVEMMMPVLNRIMGIGTKLENSEVLKYILYRYFTQKTFNSVDTEENRSLCRTMSDTLANDRVRFIENNYDSGDFSSLERLFSVVIAENFPQSKIANGGGKMMASVIKYFCLQYGEMSLLSIDYLPVTMAMTISHKYDFVIQNNKRLSKVLKKTAFDTSVEYKMMFNKYMS